MKRPSIESCKRNTKMTAQELRNQFLKETKRTALTTWETMEYARWLESQLEKERADILKICYDIDDPSVTISLIVQKLTSNPK